MEHMILESRHLELSTPTHRFNVGRSNLRQAASQLLRGLFVASRAQLAGSARISVVIDSGTENDDEGRNVAILVDRG